VDPAGPPTLSPGPGSCGPSASSATGAGAGSVTTVGSASNGEAMRDALWSAEQAASAAAASTIAA
jgi:hypothetical protein